MKRTRNGILIPDVPIMAGGNLPNAVKGVSSGGNINPIALPLYIDVYSTLHFKSSDSVLISDNGKSWVNLTERSLPRGRYYFRRVANKFTVSKFIENKDGEFFDVGGNIISLVHNEEDTINASVAEIFSSTHVVDASKLYITECSSDVSRQYMGVFLNCADLLVAPQLLATELIDGCYRQMFNGCVSLESIILPATTLVNECYWYALANCINLKRIECRASEYLESACSGWVGNIARDGVFVKKRGVEWPTGNSGIPSGWTIEEVD